jgi:hypothetical protein
MKNSVMIAVVLMVGICGSAFGTLTYSGAAEYSAGSGSNTAYVAVDFDYGNAFVFEYNWNGTGGVLWDALSAVAAAGDLDVSATNYGDDELPNYLINDIGYSNAVKHPYNSSLYPYWNIFTSQDGAAWTSPAKDGVSQVVVQNGNWYSMLWTYADFDGSNFTPVRQPGSNPIPEPATMAILGLGMILAVRKK